MAVAVLMVAMEVVAVVARCKIFPAAAHASAPVMAAEVHAHCPCEPHLCDDFPKAAGDGVG